MIILNIKSYFNSCLTLAAMGAFSGVCVVASHSASAQPEADFYYGACVHFAQGKGEENVLFMRMAQAGLNSLRDEMYWSRVERQKGVIEIPEEYRRYLDRATEEGVLPLMVLSYGNPLYGGKGTYPHDAESLEGYAKYCEYIVSKYKGKIPVYEIWNEWGGMPDPSTGPSSEEDYARLLEYVIPRLRKIDPDAKFIAGWRDPLSPQEKAPRWIENFLEAGGLRHLDGYSSHPYGYYGSAIAPTREVEHLAERMEALQALLKQHNDGKEMPIYITEIGYPTYSGRHGMLPEAQANFVSRIFLTAKTLPYVRGVWFYDLQDDGYRQQVNEHNFGLLRPDGTPKPGYWGLVDTVNELRKLTFRKRIETDDPQVWLLQFEDADGQPVWAAWSGSSTHQHQIVLEADRALFDSAQSAQPVVLEVTPAGRPSFTVPFGYREWLTPDSKLNRVRPNPRQASVTLTNTPLFIRGPLDKLDIARIVPHEFTTVEAPVRSDAAYPNAIAPSSMLTENADVFWKQLSAAGGQLPENLNWVRIGKRGNDANSPTARFASCYTVDRLFLFVEVSDLIHHQKETGAAIWRGDSIQIGLSDYAPSTVAQGALSEVSVALTEHGVEVYRHIDIKGRAPAAVSDIEAVVKHLAGKTFYAVSIPVDAVGLSYLRPTGYIRFSMVVNNSDDGSRSWSHWGGGIAEGKDPSAYNWLALLPAEVLQGN